MKKFGHHLQHWLRFRLFYYLPFTRPANLVIDGAVNFNTSTIIFFDKDSKVVLEKNVRLKSTKIHCNGSTLTIGKNSKFTNGRLIINNSSVNMGDNWTVNNTMISINNRSTVKGDGNVLFGSQKYYSSGLFTDQSVVTFGHNVSIYAHVICNGSVLTTGDNVFINEGTQIRCHNNITFGNNILVSYECIIFDTNTHSLDAQDRHAEMRNGYPNKTLQTPGIKQTVKTAPINIGNDVWVGTRAIIFKGTQIGNDVIVGAGAVIAGQTTGDHTRVFGNPAQCR